jgi:hypothetical protein
MPSCAGIIGAMSVPSSEVARDAAAVAEAAVALAGHEVHAVTRDLIDQMGRGDIGGDEAAQAIIAQFLEAPQHT